MAGGGDIFLVRIFFKKIGTEQTWQLESCITEIKIGNKELTLNIHLISC